MPCFRLSGLLRAPVGVLACRAALFLELFPGRVLYAVKCNPHPRVLRALYDAGIRHFDTASLPEIALVREGFADAGAYFMHPVKARAVIRTAARVYGVDTFVVDHFDELAKVLDETDGGEGVTIMVRVKTPQVEGTFHHPPLSPAPSHTDGGGALLVEARSRGCQVGLAFHVGSQCLVPGAYGQALAIVGEVLEQARLPIQMLDVGGGFPVEYVGTNMPPLEDFIAEIEAGAKALKLRRDCVLMCEPGRALVADGSLPGGPGAAAQGRPALTSNDGIYGSLSEMVTAGLRLPARLVRFSGAPSANRRNFNL